MVASVDDHVREAILIGVVFVVVVVIGTELLSAPSEEAIVEVGEVELIKVEWV